jgi:hypothetical protein
MHQRCFAQLIGMHESRTPVAPQLKRIEQRFSHV